MPLIFEARFPISLRSLIALPLLLISLSGLAEQSPPSATEKTALKLRFLKDEEASKALTEGEALKYYQSLQLGEMRAKTGLPLADMSLEEARELTVQHYGTETRSFSINEKNAIAGVLQRLTPSMKAKAPLYARQPWCFIKVSVKVEGGLPHTRGDCIVFSPSVLDNFARLHSQKRFKDLDLAAANLLIHEQTHVLQRQHAPLFDSLYTDVLGFRHLRPAPVPNRLREYHVANPDAPDTGWAYPVNEGVITRWIMPYLALKVISKPAMPKDFITFGIPVLEKNGRWIVVDDSLESTRQFMSNFMTYASAFPNPGQAYHPNELSADMLASWITGNGNANLEHKASTATIAWAQKHLR